MTPGDGASGAALPPRVDVAVIGGGPAGASVALALARRGVRVALLARRPTRPRPSLGESLPPAATPLLQELGLWGDPRAHGHRPAPGIRSRWGGAEPTELDFVRQPYSTGWHLDRQRFDAQLVQAARAAGVLWRDGTGVRALARTPAGSWHLTLAHPTGTGGEMVETPILVDASGRARWLARALGLRVLAYDRLVATVATYAPSAADADQRTLVEAVPEGWWYATPLPDGRLVVAHLSDADLAAHARIRTRVGWEAGLRRTTEIGARVARHGGRLDEGPRPVSAASSRLETMSGSGWWAVGDAAAAHDPLSSQGLMMALEAATLVARAIAGCETETSYAAWAHDAYARYLARWLGYYALERRWPAAPFWQRRHALWERVMQE